jgi:hypothetical protein
MSYLIWGLVAITAVLSWAVLFSEKEIWSELLHPAHRNAQYVFMGLGLIVLATSFLLGLLRGLKLIIASSATAFLVALARGWLVSRLDGDCSVLCLGLLNDALGLGCGSADAGCAVEFFFSTFLLVFLLTVFWLLTKGAFGKQRRSRKVIQSGSSE